MTHLLWHTYKYIPLNPCMSSCMIWYFLLLAGCVTIPNVLNQFVINGWHKFVFVNIVILWISAVYIRTGNDALIVNVSTLTDSFCIEWSDWSDTVVQGKGWGEVSELHAWGWQCTRAMMVTWATVQVYVYSGFTYSLVYKDMSLFFSIFIYSAMSV